MKKKKHYSYYYFDEANDDFANNGIEQKEVGANYQYLPKNIAYRICKPLLYYFILLLFAIYSNTIGRIPFKNRKCLRSIPLRQGYFIYGNHTSWIPDTVIACSTAFPRACYTIANPDAVSIKGAGTLVKMLGAMPTPTELSSYKTMYAAVEKLYKKGCAISIFPEAHIWPKYNKIRKFSSVSFDFPVRLNAPCFTKTQVYVKQKDGTTKPMIVFDGPFYPNPELKPVQAKKELCERIYNQMVSRVEEFESALDCRYSYTKVDSADQVRTEITEA